MTNHDTLCTHTQERETAIKLLIRNLARTTTEEELRLLFETHGKVQYCNLIFDKLSGDSKGFGFIEMPKPGDAKAAMKTLNEMEVGGNRIALKRRIQLSPKEATRAPNPASKSTIEIACDVTAQKKTGAAVELGPKQMLIITDLHRENFESFRVFRLRGIDIDLGIANLVNSQPIKHFVLLFSLFLDSVYFLLVVKYTRIEAIDIFIQVI